MVDVARVRVAEVVRHGATARKGGAHVVVVVLVVIPGLDGVLAEGAQVSQVRDVEPSLPSTTTLRRERPGTAPRQHEVLSEPAGVRINGLRVADQRESGAG